MECDLLVKQCLDHRPCLGGPLHRTSEFTRTLLDMPSRLFRARCEAAFLAVFVLGCTDAPCVREGVWQPGGNVGDHVQCPSCVQAAGSGVFPPRTGPDLGGALLPADSQHQFTALGLTYVHIVPLRVTIAP